MPVPLIFVRHGETDWNRELRFQGQRDIPLNARGRLQEARNGRAIAGLLRMGEWAAVASPLGRAVETMRIALAAAGRPDQAFALEPALVEVHYGDWEGLTLADIGMRFADAARTREADKWGYAPPNGESYAMLAERVAKWLSGLPGPTMVVAHGGILRVLLHLLAGLPAHDAPHLACPHDRVMLFTQQSVFAI